MKRLLLIILGIVVVIFLFVGVNGGKKKNIPEHGTVIKQSSDSSQTVIGENDNEVEGNAKEMNFSRDGLSTDASKRSIPLDEVLDGWPGKDGIPPIDTPIFLSVDLAMEQMSYLIDNALGILLIWKEQARFYSYAIMNWHEIVNDELDWLPVAVTFCPLCGSAIVFLRDIDGEKIRFGVSWKLYQSNLLMYDDRTESLWSQALGEAVVGEYVWRKLQHIKSDVITFGEFKERYPDGLVLSDETGYVRNYASSPYGDYDINDTLFFPVNNSDARLPKKEILYVVNDGNTSVAFVKDALREAGEASIQVENDLYRAEFVDGLTNVFKNDYESPLPWYHEMWFSRVTHNPGSKNIRIGN